MVHVQVKRTSDGKISSFIMEGHANFAKRGQDIVCAGASAVAFGSLNAIIALTEIELEIQQSKSGFLKCSIPSELSVETSEKVQLLLEGMIISLQTIERDYKKYIKVSFSDQEVE